MNSLNATRPGDSASARPATPASESRLILRLFRCGSDREESLVVDRFPAMVGRGQESALSLDDNFVSQVHCLLNYLNGLFVVQDLESRNGTQVNGQCVTIARLAVGDVIDVGVTRIVVDAMFVGGQNE